jgi:hypothetical protein
MEMNSKITVLILTWLGLLLICACSQTTLAPTSAPSQTLASELIHNSLLCGDDITRPTALWILNEEALQQRYRRFNESAETAGLPSAVDFNSRGVLLIGMGPRPTSGFRLNPLPQQQPRFDGTTLEVPVAWQEPDSAAAEAQVLTNPCLLLAIPQVEFSRLRIIDQNGVVRIETGRAAALASGS